MNCPHGPLRGDYYRKDPSEVAKAVCEGISEKHHVASNYSTVGDVLNRASKSKGKRVYTWRKCVVWPSESLAFYFAIRGRSVRELLLWLVVYCYSRHFRACIYLPKHRGNTNDAKVTASI